MIEVRKDFKHPVDLEKRPFSWAVCAIGDVCSVVQSGFASGKHNRSGEGIPHLRPMNISRDGLLDFSELKFVDPETDSRRLELGDVIFNNTNSPVLVGKTCVINVDQDLAFSNHMTKLRAKDGLVPNFLAYQLHYLFITGYFLHRCVKHVNQASFSVDPLSRTVPFLLPPTLEQERIVSSLDEKLTKIKAAEDYLISARAKLKSYRASVLKAAVEGRLVSTEAELARQEGREYEPADMLLEQVLVERRRQWEEAELEKMRAKGKEPRDDKWKEKYKEPVGPDTAGLPDLPEGWCWVSLEQVTYLITSGSRGWKKYYYHEGAVFIRAQDIKTDQLAIDGAAYVKLPDRAEGQRTKVKIGDILITITGANVTKSAVVNNDLGEAYVSQHVGLCRPVLADFRGYLYSWVICPSAGRKDLLKAAYGAGKPGLSLDNIRELFIALPPIHEQQRIVSEIDRLLSVAEDQKVIFETNLRRCHRLRQALLKWAFEGKLVPQDPNDEPASVLLERIRAERNGTAPEQLDLPATENAPESS